MPVHFALVVALVVALVPAGPASAQQDPPRIGLVLSGGAARGAAHVGVLRVLEELRIPIHAIAGTSMGAVVGGLYASGLTAEALERELTDTDWTAVFRDDIARGSVSFRRKQEQRSMLLDPELGIGPGGIRLPPGLVEGHRLGLLLDTLLLPVLDRRDFGRLPIPFRATATDIETGELVVLEGGDLSEAIRASMAFPAAFSPVMVEGRLLVDGGIVRNLPLDLVRDMGVDVVIAVDVGSDLDPRESLRSLLGVARQTVTLVTRHNTAASIEADPPDLLIRPVIGDIPFTAFPRSRELIERGDSAARAAADALRSWSLPADAYADWRRRVRESRGLAPVIDRVRVEHDDPERARRLRRELRIEPGRRIEAGTLAADLDRLYGRGLYDRVGFTIERENGGTTLVVRPVPESPGPELRFGLALGDDFSGRGGFALQAQLLVQRVTAQGGEARLVARAGDDRHVGAELYQPVGGASPAFLAAGLVHRRRFVEGPLPGVPTDYEEQRTRSGLRAGLHAGTWAEATAGVEVDHVEAGPTGGVAEAPVFEGRVAALVARVEVDLLDDAEFPRRGLLTFGEIRVVPAGWADVPAHSRLEGGISLAVGRGPHSLVLTAGGAGPLDGPLPFHDRFRLGGPLERSALAPLDALGEKLAVGRVLYLYRFGPGGVARAGLALELGEAWTDPAPSFPGGLRAGATGLVAVRTVLGPAFVSLGVGEGGRWLGRLVLGRLTF